MTTIFLNQTVNGWILEEIGNHHDKHSFENPDAVRRCIKKAEEIMSEAEKPKKPKPEKP